MNCARASGSSMERGSTAASAGWLSGIAPSMAAALDCVTCQRAGHAVAAAPPLAQLETGDGNDLDARVPHPRDGVGVALVGDDDAGLDGHGVVGVVPLLALGLVLVAARLDHVQALHAQCIRHRAQQVLLLGYLEPAVAVGRAD